MPLPLRDVLNHPSLARAEPVQLTGQEHASRDVRWVHSSEVLDIAPLLRGGELLLTGGLMLSEADPERQRCYIRDLATHGITAVAAETAAPDVGLPGPLIDEAQQHEFALIQLNRTVPFVEVAESINGLLVSDSVHRLRLADSLSDTLSTELTSGADLQQLAETLGSTISAEVVVRDNNGEALAASTSASDVRTPSEPWHAPIAVHGVTTALLELLPAKHADPPTLEAALDRAPQAFGLALLRTRPPTPDARAVRALFRALRAPASSDNELTPLISAAGLDSTAPFVAVTANHAEPAFYGALEQAMRRDGRPIVSQTDEEFLALASLPSDREETSRQALVDDVRHVNELATEHPTVAVGPWVPDGARLARTIAEARRCLDPDLQHAAFNGVVDADSCSLDRLVHRLDSDETLREFIHEQLGPVLAQPPQTRGRLLRTLETFFDCAANKTETAQRLHLRRQTLYQRLNTVSRHLGHAITDLASIPDLQVAVRLLQVLERNAHRSV